MNKLLKFIETIATATYFFRMREKAEDLCSVPTRGRQWIPFQPQALQRWKVGKDLQFKKIGNDIVGKIKTLKRLQPLNPTQGSQSIVPQNKCNNTARDLHLVEKIKIYASIACPKSENELNVVRKIKYDTTVVVCFILYYYAQSKLLPQQQKV